MTEDDFKDFAEFMYSLEYICLKVKDKELTSVTIKFYFHCLQDVDLKDVVTNGYAYCNQANELWFPSPKQLRGIEGNQDVKALQAWDKINKYLEAYWFGPGFVECSMKVIQRKMEKNKEEHLMPLLNKWGGEILSSGAIAATRKHFIDSFKIDLKVEETKALAGKDDSKRLEGLAAKMLDK